jgi:hypothetical protein
MYMAHKQGLVEAGLELVRHQQDVEVLALEGCLDVAALQVGVHGLPRLGEGLGAALQVVDLAGEGHQRAEGVTLLPDVLVDGQLPADGLLAGAEHDHGLRPPAEERRDVLAEVLDDDLHLLADVVRVQLHPAHQSAGGGAALDLVVGDLLALVGESEREAVGRVVLQHVEDEALLDGLAHGVQVERLRQVALAGGQLRVRAGDRRVPASSPWGWR